MPGLADSFDAPYYAVIFSSVRRPGDDEQYAAAAERMARLAADQPGYLGVESARDESGAGITVSYWTDLDSIQAWRRHAEHAETQRLGRDQWYQEYRLRVCRVERDRSWESDQ